jgi:hypothetical protein
MGKGGGGGVLWKERCFRFSRRHLSANAGLHIPERRIPENKLPSIQTHAWRYLQRRVGGECNSPKQAATEEEGHPK